jgi:Zn-dependent protease
VALKLGDPTARNAGRLTLNPLVHIDPIGTIIFPLALVLFRSPVIFAWAKPVPVNPLNFRNPRRDMLWVGLAGPGSNILIAIIATVLLKVSAIFMGMGGPLGQLLMVIIFINLLLAVFNLIPIPPLDGSRVLTGLLPRELAYSYARLERFGILILFAFFYLGLIGRLILPVVEFLFNLLLH